jgi:hypothetical protein
MDKNGCHACQSCGFLSLRAVATQNAANPIFREFGPEARQTGVVGVVIGIPGADKGMSPLPMCIRGAADLWGEMLEFNQQFQQGAAKAVLHVLEQPRKCDKWHAYTPGLDPSQHLEEHRMLELERMRREWEERQEETRRRWEKELEQDRREWEERLASNQLEANRKWDAALAKARVRWERLQNTERECREEHQRKMEGEAKLRDERFARTMYLFGGILALAQLLAAIIALTPDAAIYRWLGLEQAPGTPSSPTSPASP